MGAPQIIYISLVAMGIGIALIQHGQLRTGRHNVLGTLIGSSVACGLLYWGGFFS